MRQMWVIVSLVALCGVAVCGADEVTVKSRIVSVGLFKNGLAVVRREVKLPGAGTFVLEQVPEPIHGTFWIQSDVALEAHVSERELKRPLRTDASFDFQKMLEGRTVTIFFKEAQIPAATGKVEAVAQAKGESAWSRRYQPPSYDYWGNLTPAQPGTAGRYLVLQTETSKVFVDTSLIAYVKVEGKEDSFTQRLPVLSLKSAGDKPVTAVISYLTRGLAWAPSYRVDISDPKTLTLEQSAIVKNELEDLEGAEMQLISGFPSVQFAHVISPLSPRTSWAQFFQQLNQRIAQGSDLTSNVSQQRVAYNEPAAVDLGAQPAGEGVDLHYQSVGARSLKEGASLSLSIATEKAAYERIVEWIIPDTRDEAGNFISDWQRQQDPDKYRDAAWDAVRFKNPFKFPMTTGAAAVFAGDKFNGARTSLWVNCGEETSLQVTKALSVRTRSTEREEEGQRDQVNIGGRQYRKALVKGELAVNNHRNEAVKIVIRRQFSGELLEAEGEPMKSLREEGVYSVNPRQQLLWTVTLKPGEQKTLTYRYSVRASH